MCQQDRQDDRIMYDNEFARLRREAEIAEGIATQAKNSLEVTVRPNPDNGNPTFPRL